MSNIIKGPIEWSMNAADEHVNNISPKWRKPEEVKITGLYIQKYPDGIKELIIFNYTWEDTLKTKGVSAVPIWKDCIFYGPIPE